MGEGATSQGGFRMLEEARRWALREEHNPAHTQETHINALEGNTTWKVTQRCLKASKLVTMTYSSQRTLMQVVPGQHSGSPHPLSVRLASETHPQGALLLGAWGRHPEVGRARSSQPVSPRIFSFWRDFWTVEPGWGLKSEP